MPGAVPGANFSSSAPPSNGPQNSPQKTETSIKVLAKESHYCLRRDHFDSLLLFQVMNGDPTKPKVRVPKSGRGIVGSCSTPQQPISEFARNAILAQSPPDRGGGLALLALDAVKASLLADHPGREGIRMGRFLKVLKVLRESRVPAQGLQHRVFSFFFFSVLSVPLWLRLGSNVTNPETLDGLGLQA